MSKSIPIFLASIMAVGSLHHLAKSGELSEPADQSLAVSNEDVNNSAFAVDTRVYVEDKKEPLVQTTTVFAGRRAYDQMVDTGSLAVFDFETKSIQLIDRRRSLRTGISFDEMLRFQAELRGRAESAGGLAAFLANPTFGTEFDAGASTISLRSEWLTYTAKVANSQSDSAERFLQFADWSARLASMLGPTDQGSSRRRAHSAQARLKLNEALKKQNWRVTHITRTGGPSARSLGTVRSEHVYRAILASRDRDLIRGAEKLLKEFKRVSFSTYHEMQNSERVATKR